MKCQSKQSFIVIGFLLGAVILLWTVMRGDGPRYKGRNASQWLTEGARRKGLAAEYPRAVKELHTNFVPVFLHADPYARSGYIDWIEQTGIPLFERLPRPLQKIVPEPVSRVGLYRAAVNGFAHLGQVAPKEEIAELLKEDIRHSPVGEHEWKLRFLFSYLTGEPDRVDIPVEYLKHPEFAVRFHTAWMSTFGTEDLRIKKFEPDMARHVAVLTEVLTNTVAMAELFGDARNHWRTLAHRRLKRISPEVASKYGEYDP